jgi:type I restriction enzyme S subunit
MTDINNLITDNIDVWTSAIKKRNSQGRGSSKKTELPGIKKLRELILELAVRGKLVPQNSDDEPASVLLEKIIEEKAQVLTDKKIRKQKPLPAITDKDKPFEVPKNWEWLRLGNAGVGSTGKTPSTRNAEYFGGNIQFIGPGNITPLGQLLKADKFLTELGVEQSSTALAGDLLMVCIGGSIGKNTIAEERIAFNQQINVMQPIELLSKFLKHTVSTHTFYMSVLEASTGSATPIINRSKWEELLIPVAPLAEQHRIVAKVDELMALCDELEQQTEQSFSAHQTLVEVLLGSLFNNAEGSLTASDNTEALAAMDGGNEGNEGAFTNKEGFQTSWQRIAKHFDVLFTNEHSIEQLKQTILQLAVMGKLVPQDPSDEPASVLLEKIAEEKAQFITNKRQKQKPLPAITDEEKSFDLPNGWEWGRVGDLLSLKNGYAFKSKHFVENKSEYILATPGNFYEEGGFRHRGEKTKYYDGPIYSEFVFEPGDLIIPMTEQAAGLLGSAAFVPKDQNKYLHNQRLGKLSPYSNFTNLEFIYLFFNSSFLREELARTCTGMKVRHTSPDRILTVLIPVMSPKEQVRIVAKVYELMALCEQLKARLVDSQTTQLHLADAVVEEALTR